MDFMGKAERRNSSKRFSNPFQPSARSLNSLISSSTLNPTINSTLDEPLRLLPSEGRIVTASLPPGRERQMMWEGLHLT